MNATADAASWGPGFHPGARGFEFPVEEVRRRMKAHMTGPGRHGQWGGPLGPRGGWGPGPGGPGGPEGGWPFGPGPRGRGGRAGRAGRGDVRTAILALLAEEPRHGYQVIQEISERSGGAWKPSPGSVYPALSVLQDEGLVDDEKVEGKRVFSLTAAGTAYVAERADELAKVFDLNSAEAEDEGVTDLRQLLAGVAGAAFQVVQAGTPEQLEAAREVLKTARRDLYRLLAEDGEQS
jgi:DNA-binding PadR family transcriptional regulator